MKLSLKLRDDTPNQPPLLKSKIPITVLTLPFIAGLTAGHASDLSFSLTSNFPSCPSLRLSYSPTTNTSPSPTTPNPGPSPFTLTLKSGVGSFGSPKDSPLTISANLNLFHDRHPTFTLHVKPHFGHFCVHKTAHSVNNPSLSKPGPGSDLGVNDPGLMGWSNIDLVAGGGENGKGVMWRDLERNGVLEGFKVRARSELPLGRRVMVNFRWGVNFGNEGRKERMMPYLTVDKIGIQRVVEVDKIGSDVNGEVEKLSGIYGWMRRELEEARRENRELRVSLEGIKAKAESRGTYSSNNGFEERRSKGKPGSGSSYSSMAYSGYPDVKSRRGEVEENVGLAKEIRKGVGVRGTSSLESELQKAIKAAAAS